MQAASGGAESPSRQSSVRLLSLVTFGVGMWTETRTAACGLAQSCSLEHPPQYRAPTRSRRMMEFARHSVDLGTTDVLRVLQVRSCSSCSRCAGSV